MECVKAEERFDPYLRGELSPRETAELDSHLDSCQSCSVTLRADGEMLASLAFAVPQVEVPERVREGLLSVVGSGAVQPAAAPGRGLLERVRLSLRKPMPVHWASAAVSIVVLSLVIGGVWMNGRFADMADANQAMNSRIAAVKSENSRLLTTIFEREAHLRNMVSEARYLSSMTASPGVSVSLLRGTEHLPDAWGMVACCADTGDDLAALIAVLNLDELSQDETYQVWVITKYQKLGVGLLDVDSTGYAQAVIIPGVPFSQIEAIGITVEPAGGSHGPTGASVLAGDM